MNSGSKSLTNEKLQSIEIRLFDELNMCSAFNYSNAADPVT